MLPVNLRKHFALPHLSKRLRKLAGAMRSLLALGVSALCGPAFGADASAAFMALTSGDLPAETCNAAGPTPAITALAVLPPGTRYRFSPAFVVPYYFDDEGEFNLIWNQDATLLVSAYLHPGVTRGPVALPLPPLAAWYAGFGGVPARTELALRVAAYDEAGRTLAASRLTWDCTSGTVLSLTHRGNALLAPAQVSLVEYYNASLDHYFMSADAAELADLDDGRHAGWTRTGRALHVLARDGAGADGVCRFYLPPSAGDSHFYAASARECADVAARFPQFVLESSAAFAVFAADAASGACPPGTIPVYRLWNARADSNHRYVTDIAARDLLVSAGYLPEGYGPDAVAFCALP